MEPSDTDRYDPEAIEARWQAVWAAEGSFTVPNPEPGAASRGALHLRPRDAAVPVRRAPHGARLQLHARRRLRARPPAPGVHRPAADGLRRVRPELRERRDQGGRSPARHHEPQHRGDPAPDEAHGVGDRLVARGLDRGARVLPLDAVAVPPLLRARALLSPRGAGQVVPEGPDRARERAGDRRALRALRHARSSRRASRSGSSRSPTTPTSCSTRWTRSSRGPTAC